MRICLIEVSPGRTMRNTATAGSRRCSSDWRNRRSGARSAAITKLCRLSVGMGSRVRGIEAEDGERGLRPADGTRWSRFSSQPPMPAEALRVAEQVGEPFGLARPGAR